MASLSMERDPPLRRVQLDAGPMNALNLEAVVELADALKPDEDAPVVVLRGRSDAFCAGLDNATLSRAGAEREELLAAMGELLLTAVRGPTRLVAACAGHAVAAGAMLLLVADLRIGARCDYKVGFTEPRLGLALPELPALLARERLERRRLHELTVLGRTLGPEAALAAGFLDEIVPEEELENVAAERAREIAALSDSAYRGSVSSVWGGAIERMSQLVRAQLEKRDAAREAGV